MILKVRVHPNSKSPRIEEKPTGELHIYVREPAKENKANDGVVKILSEKYRVSKSSIKLIHGEKSKTKVFEIN